MDSEMQEIDSHMGEPNGGDQNSGMRHHISRKAGTEMGIKAYPTSPVRDLIGANNGIENQDDRQMIQTRSKIQKCKNQS